MIRSVSKENKKQDSKLQKQEIKKLPPPPVKKPKSVEKKVLIKQEKTEKTYKGHSVTVINLSEVHQWIEVSMTDVNRFFCQKGEITDVIFSAEKRVQAKIKGKNAFVKLVPTEVVDTFTGQTKHKYRTKPFELYVICGDEVFSMIAKPAKIPARTFILAVPHKPQIKEAISFLKERTYEKALVDLTLAAININKEIPHGFSIEEINTLYARYDEADIVLRRKIKGVAFEVWEFLITANKPVTLSESIFFANNPASVCILDLKLKKGQMTRAFVIKKKKASYPSRTLIMPEEHKKLQEEIKKKIRKEKQKQENKAFQPGVTSGFFGYKAPKNSCTTRRCMYGQKNKQRGR
ncbi:MAG TPA: hypothetical protein ENF38_00620 [Candidatus Aenigmarchaeota archaeon]|nr:hypothetical protein [Candidatus Aenigmarchaeota archaeon]